MFRDREDAGRRLAAELRSYAAEDPIVLALPRGGVTVGYQIARALGTPLDVLIVRKVGVPWQPELGIGAISEGGHLHMTRRIRDAVAVPDDVLATVVERERAEVERRVRTYRGDRPRAALRDRTVILVDDGIATGGTVHAAILATRAEAPRQIVLAVPVASAATLEELESHVDRVVCLEAPHEFIAVGLWYEEFRQVSDDEVIRLLERARSDRDDAAADVA